MTKKILLLGGSKQQLVAIEKAKELGYKTILCDYLKDNPGKEIADKFYLVSTTDKEKVLQIAKAEEIDGVVAYASDPAAPTAAYVSTELGLPGVSYDVARSFCEKHLFRSFLAENKFNVPKSVEVDLGAIEKSDFGDLSFPVIVKPTDSSGSKGVTVVERSDLVGEAIDAASQFSRNGIILVEEYIVRAHESVIEAEIFVADSQIKSWGLINSIRDEGSNPLLPAGYSYPLSLDAEKKLIVANEVSRLVKASGVKYGAFNIEMILDKKNNLFFLDAGPRNGGNMLPDFISMISGKNLVEATVRAAMDEFGEFDIDLPLNHESYWGLAVLHSQKGGLFGGISYSDTALTSLIKEELQVSRGDKVAPFEKCTDLLGLSFFDFDSKQEMEDVMGNMSKNIALELL